MAIDFLRQYVKPAVTSVGESDELPRDLRSIQALLKGEVVASEDGSCLVVESTFAGDCAHGRHTFGDLSSVTSTGLAEISRDPELRYADLTGAVFLDTETTGLNLGTGTYVFLVGAGFFADGQFRVKQFFLLSPSEEAPYLATLDAFLRGFSVLITFNGKAFDWPLLENRFVGHRSFRRAPLEDPPHVDLLHPARRLWKRRLESCALSSLEKHILGVSRTEEDVPGWLIPSIYFAYVRSGSARALKGVFYHNLQDILSLATLTVHIHRVLADPLGGLVVDGIDFLSLAKNYERAGDGDYAVACLEEAMRYALNPDEIAECLTRLATIHKRERRWDAALTLWERLIDGGSQAAIQALVERAKFYEHVERSYLEALEDVQQAFALLELSAGAATAIDVADLEHRRARLLNRAYRRRSWVSVS